MAKYHKDFHCSKLYEVLAKGGTLEGACPYLGTDITLTVAREWLTRYPSFKEAYDRGYARGSATFEEVGISQMMNPKPSFDANIYKALKSRFRADRHHVSLSDCSPTEKLDRLLTMLIDSSEVVTAQVAQSAAAICDRIHTHTEIKDLKDRIEQLEDSNK